jgi:hypothetical protein
MFLLAVLFQFLLAVEWFTARQTGILFSYWHMSLWGLERDKSVGGMDGKMNRLRSEPQQSCG